MSAGVQGVIPLQVKKQKISVVADRVSFFPRQGLWLLLFGRLIGDRLDVGQRQRQLVALGDDGGLAGEPPTQRRPFLVQNQVQFGDGFLERLSVLGATRALKEFGKFLASLFDGLYGFALFAMDLEVEQKGGEAGLDRSRQPLFGDIAGERSGRDQGRHKNPKPRHRRHLRPLILPVRRGKRHA